MKDLLSLQVARALAVLLVVVYHAHGVLEKRAAALGLAEVRFWAEETNVVKFGATGVDIFFVISGFIIYHTTARRPVSAWAFMRSRVIRVYPLWWVALSMMAVMALLPGTSAEVRGAELLQSALLWPYRQDDGQIKPFLPIGWTLHYEMCFYVVFAVAMAGFRRHRLWVCTVFFAGCVLLGVVWPPQAPVGVIASQALVGEFIVGMWIARAYQAGVRWGSGYSVLTLGIVVLLSWVYVVAETPWAGQQTWIRGPLAGGLIAALTLGRGLSSWHYPRGLTLIGDASYAIYLFHMFPIMLLSGLWKRGIALPPAGMSPVFTWLLVACGGMLVGVLAHFWVERPLLARVRQWCLPSSERARIVRTAVSGEVPS